MLFRSLIAAVLTATAMSLKLPRLLTQELCSSGGLPATSLGAFDGAAQGPQAWASKSAYELTQNTKTTGYGDAGQYVKSATCKLSATTCGAGYTHDDYALAKKQTGAVDAACVKCAAGKWSSHPNFLCATCVTGQSCTNTACPKGKEPASQTCNLEYDVDTDPLYRLAPIVTDKDVVCKKTMMACSACAAGKYNAKENLMTGTGAAGTRATTVDLTDGDKCKCCTAGKFIPAPAAAAAGTLWPVGAIIDPTGSTSVVTCPAGKFAKACAKSATDCTACAKGMYGRDRPRRRQLQDLRGRDVPGQGGSAQLQDQRMRRRV